MEEVKVKGQFTGSDYVAANKLNNRSTIWSLIIYWLGWLVFSFVVIYFAMLIARDNQKADYIFKIILGAFFLDGIIKTIRFEKGKKEWYQDDTINREIEYTINLDGISFKSEFEKNTFIWKFFKRWREDNDIISISFSFSRFLVLPKRMLLEEEIDFVKKQLNKNKIPKTFGRNRLLETMPWFAASILILFILTF